MAERKKDKSDNEKKSQATRDKEHRKEYPTTEDLMRGGGNRDTATPGDGVLTSQDVDRDAATG